MAAQDTMNTAANVELAVPERSMYWGAVISGSLIAVALMIFFTTLGIAMGAAAVDPLHDADPMSGMTASSGVYLVVTQLISLAAGGFVAARCAGFARPIASALHGAAVWAVATIFLALASMLGATALFGAAGSILSNSAQSVGTTVSQALPDDLELPDPSQLASQISLDDLPDALRTRLEEAGVTDANLQQEARAAFRDVFSEAEQAAALDEARATLQDIVMSPNDIRADLDAFADNLIGGPNAILSEEDRAEAMTALQERFGISPDEAGEVADQVQAGIEAAVTEARDTAEALRTDAIEAAQAASDAVASVALALAVASLLGLAAAAGGAYAGRPDGSLGDRLDDRLEA